MLNANEVLAAANRGLRQPTPLRLSEYPRRGSWCNTARVPVPGAGCSVPRDGLAVLPLFAAMLRGRATKSQRSETLLRTVGTEPGHAAELPQAAPALPLMEGGSSTRRRKSRRTGMLAVRRWHRCERNKTACSTVGPIKGVEVLHSK